jgi:hypothetical protein
MLAMTFISVRAQSQSLRGVQKVNFDSILPSVVTLVTYNSSGKEIGQGSGFVLVDKRIATNRHVIEGAKIVEVKNNRSELLASFAFVEAVSITADVAILPKVAHLPKGLALSVEPPKVGERVYAIGSPLGLPNTLSDGILSAIRSDLGTPLLQITAPISPGSSGGPVINERGEVLGVATASIREGQNLNFAVPVSVVLALTNSPAAKLDFPARRDVANEPKIESEKKTPAVPRPSMQELIPQNPLGWIDEKDFRLFLMGCYADEKIEITVCAVDLEVKRANGTRYTIGIGSPTLTSPQGGESKSHSVWLNTENFLQFNPWVEIYSAGGRPRTHIMFRTSWREGASYQLTLGIYGGESELKKFWSGRNIRSYTFTPQTIRFIDASKDDVTKKLLGIQ